MPLDVLALMRDSVAAPAAAAGRLVSLRLSRRAALELAVLVSALGALFVGVAGGGGLTLPMGEGAAVTVGPIAYGLALLASLLVSAAAMHFAGTALGGRGTFDQALVVIAWLEVVALAVRFVQLAAFLLLPVLAPVLGLAGLAVLLWCLVNFVRVLHGFDGFGRTILTLLLAGLGVGVGLTLLLGLLGGLGGPANV